MTSDIFQNYLSHLRLTYETGGFTEMTFRTALETLLRDLRPELNPIQEPTRTRKLGAPDFRVYGKSVKIGYVETKEITADLDAELESDQIKKYKESIDNIILTNYLRFILIRNSERIFDFDLLDVGSLSNKGSAISENSARQFLSMLDSFASFGLPTISSARELAAELSKKARVLKELARIQLDEDLATDSARSTSSVFDFYQGIRELIKDITIDDCADAYAQTVIFGLFIAKLHRADSKLDRASATASIPHSMALIRKIFLNLADSLPPNVSWMIDDIVDLLNASDLKEVLSDIGDRAKARETSFIMFYEDFLSHFDPKKRKHMGVYYTPRPVVSFITNSVNQILKKEFGKALGFAEEDVTVLDPAVGTGTFLRMAYLCALLELKRGGLSGLIEQKIRNHLRNISTASKF